MLNPQSSHATLGNASPALVRPVALAREKAVSGWLRIAFFLSILFNHTVRYADALHFDERMLLVWLNTLRDFGAVGFFLLAGASLQGKRLAGGPVRLQSNVLKLTIAAALLAAFDFAFETAKGNAAPPLRASFYTALYDTNLWFFVAYAFAGPMLLALERRAAWWTAACCLVFVMFPATPVLQSPYILQTISLAFICMLIGAELHGRQLGATACVVVAATAFLGRVWMDDYGTPLWNWLDVVLRLAYGVACFHLLKLGADALIRRGRAAPRLSNYLFVPYVIQFPLIVVTTVVATALFTRSVDVRMPPIFGGFWEHVAFVLVIFGLCAIVSFAVAAVLRRHDVRL